MTSSALPTPADPAGPASPSAPAAGTPPLDALFGELWPEHGLDARPRAVGAAVAVGLLAAIVLPFRDPGVATSLVLLASGVTVLVAGRVPRSRSVALGAGLCGLLVLAPWVRDADWVAALCVLAALAVGIATLVEARSVAGILAAGAAVPLAGLRGLPWLGRSVRGAGRIASALAVARTVVLSLLLLGVFGALFASADSVFAAWVGAALPDLSADSLVARGFVLVVVAGVTMAATYTALNPPRVERLAAGSGAPVRHRFEWLAPVGVVLAAYVGFVLAQLSVMFGGHGYLRRTTGLTYAEYVHQGFGQLTVATVLTLGVVAVAARKAPRATAGDRLALRAVLGALCVLTLVVVASALYRMHVYEQAYGFTRLRLLVSVFEAWLGLVVVLVIAAGARLSGRWIPRTALLAGAVAMLALAAVNPDGYIASRNVDRYLETGKADWSYLAGLSADAVPALHRLPADVQPCVLGRDSRHDDWLEWNLGRSRAGDQVPTGDAACVSP